MESPVDGHRSTTCLKAGEHGFQHLGVVVLKQRHVVSLPDTQFVQRVRKAVHSGIKLSIGEPPEPCTMARLFGKVSADFVNNLPMFMVSPRFPKCGRQTHEIINFLPHSFCNVTNTHYISILRSHVTAQAHKVKRTINSVGRTWEKA